jgi:hypothetical protein
VAADAGIGAALGGVGGLLLSFAGLAIPGIGPILAAGPIIAALGGAGIGAAAGGLIGGLTEHGVPEEHAHHYAEGVRRGDILITVRTEGDRAERAAAIMDDNGAVDIDHRVADWKNRGWERHDTSAEPLSADEIRRERSYYNAAQQQGDEWRDETRRNSDLSAGVLGLGPDAGAGPSGALGSTTGTGTTGTGTSGGASTADVGPDRSRQHDMRNTGLGSGSSGAGSTDFTAGTAGVSTGTGPGRMVGTEAGMGTGPNSTQDIGQHRGTTPSASRAGENIVTGSEASNARRDAQRSSDYAEDTIGTRRTDLPSNQDALRRDASNTGNRVESGVERIEDKTENAMQRAGDKMREAGRETKRGAARIYDRLT